MKKVVRRLLMVVIILFQLAAISFILKEDIMMLFNKQLDTETKKIMKEKLEPNEIQKIAFSKGDLKDFKEQIALSDYKHGNRDYYTYFNDVSDAQNDVIVKKANQYKKEKIGLDTIKEYNQNEKNLEQFQSVIKNGIDGSSDAILVVNPGDNLTVVNSKRYISDYVPSNLVEVDKKKVPVVDKEKYLVTEETSNAILELCQAAYEANKKRCGGLVLTSAYRSFDEQKSLYEKMTNENSDQKEYVNQAGSSEHQLGNTIDILTKGSTQKNYAQTAQYRWIQKNAAKFGFVIRYPEGKDSITGIKFEPWHLRYVGKDVASTVQNTTLEEYHEQIYQ